MSLWKRVGCQTESKALEKSIVDRIVQEPSLGLLNPCEMESILTSVGEERIGGEFTLRKESEEELLREMLTLT